MGSFERFEPSAFPCRYRVKNPRVTGRAVPETAARRRLSPQYKEPTFRVRPAATGARIRVGADNSFTTGSENTLSPDVCVRAVAQLDTARAAPARTITQRATKPPAPCVAVSVDSGEKTRWKNFEARGGVPAAGNARFTTPVGTLASLWLAALSPSYFKRPALARGRLGTPGLARALGSGRHSHASVSPARIPRVWGPSAL